MLEVRDIVKRLPDGTTLLNKISFSVHAGEFVALLGASGAGKSLTMRCIVGLTQPDEGEVLFSDESGKVYRSTSRNARELRKTRRNIGVIFQGGNLVRRLSAIENVLIGRLGHIHPLRSLLYGFRDVEAREALEALNRVGMAAFANRQVGTLSGGEMQRVAIARAVFQKPLLYLADEPIASLDPRNSEAILSLLKPLSATAPILAAFHQPAIVRRFCTRLIALRRGTKIYDGPPELSDAQLAEVYEEPAAAPDFVVK